MERSPLSPTAWLTASEIAARYIVGEETLLAYSQRGNLALRRSADGVVRFDERAVAQLFRSRGEPSASLGVLGKIHLEKREPRRPRQTGAVSSKRPPSSRRFGEDRISVF